jgi:hypothetical protein
MEIICSLDSSYQHAGLQVAIAEPFNRSTSTDDSTLYTPKRYRQRENTAQRGESSNG